MSAGIYAPNPGRARLDRMLLAQTSMEVRLLLRNGEQLLLTIVIPALLLLLFSSLPIVSLGAARRVDFLTPGILALAVMSTAFTGQAIATGFERRYGVLKRLGATPLPRWGLVLAKSAAVLVIELLQVVLLVAIALWLGWVPRGSPALALAVFVLGTVAFSGLGLLMAGTLRAEATLAAANLVFILLLVGGGVVIPLSVFPGVVRAVLEYLPISALADGLRAVLQQGMAPPLLDIVALAGWAVVGVAVAGTTFRWD
jgi:ABC-2 type transport system permease protein